MTGQVRCVVCGVPLYQCSVTQRGRIPCPTGQWVDMDGNHFCTQIPPDHPDQYYSHHKIFRHKADRKVAA